MGFSRSRASQNIRPRQLYKELLDGPGAIVAAMPNLLSSKDIDCVTSTMDKLRLVAIQGCPDGPDSAQPCSTADHQGSPSSSSGSVSLPGLAQPQQYENSPAASTASSSGSFSLRGPARAPRQTQHQAKLFLPLDVCTDLSSSKGGPAAYACHSSSKGRPAAHRAVAATAAASSSKGPAAYQPQAAATPTLSPTSRLDLGDSSTPGLSVLRDAPPPPIPFEVWLADIGGAPVAPPPIPFEEWLADITGAAGASPMAASPLPPPSANLSPLEEPVQKVPFVDWLRSVTLEQATPCSGAPGGAGGDVGGLDESAPPSGCLSTTTQTQQRVPFAVWHELQREGEASPVRPVPFLTRSRIAPELAGDNSPLSGGGSSSGWPVALHSPGAAAILAKPVQLQLPVAAAAGGMHARAAVVHRPRIAHAAAAAGGGSLHGSPVACRRTAMPASPC